MAAAAAADFSHHLSDIPDPYTLLSVASDVSHSSLQSAYRRAARECHPDKNPNDPLAKEKFERIRKAFEFLSDEKLREAYDAHLKAQAERWKRFEKFDAEKKRLRKDLEAREKRAAAAAGETGGRGRGGGGGGGGEEQKEMREEEEIKKLRKMNEEMLKEMQKEAEEKQRDIWRQIYFRKEEEKKEGQRTEEEGGGGGKMGEKVVEIKEGEELWVKWRKSNDSSSSSSESSHSSSINEKVLYKAFEPFGILRIEMEGEGGERFEQHKKNHQSSDTQNNSSSAVVLVKNREKALEAALYFSKHKKAYPFKVKISKRKASKTLNDDDTTEDKEGDDVGGNNSNSNSRSNYFKFQTNLKKQEEEGGRTNNSWANLLRNHQYRSESESCGGAYGGGEKRSGEGVVFIHQSEALRRQKQHESFEAATLEQLQRAAERQQSLRRIPENSSAAAAASTGETTVSTTIQKDLI